MEYNLAFAFFLRGLTTPLSSKLTSLVIPNSVTSIGDSAFSKNPNLVIKCKKDSYAETYAKENKIKYEIIE